MLLPRDRPPYEAFKQTLAHLKAEASQSSVDQSALKTGLAQLQQLFQNQILSSEANSSDQPDDQRVQSYQVEINKQLRLLSTDLTFLQAARKTATAQQRQDQIRDRLTLLMTYCDALLET
ncbi:MAG: heterocyst frequency control protein PatD [Leptolyngbyaceae bacterium]|nr:heterocyst frequency control protein PatD [Leptolyngbyaceae bacterium]